MFQDIFRKYPSTYEGVIPTLCANLDELDEPEAKASLIWIIGEYANKIDNADELLSIFVDTFTEESYPVCVELHVFVRPKMLTTVKTGATTDVVGSREALLEEARLVAGHRPASPQYGDEGLRFTRRARPCVYILAIIVNRSWGSQGRRVRLHGQFSLR